jgi:probable phosphomutase (TIGR03848 family)
MTTFLLIRHATTDWVGNALAGDTPGVHLNHQGRDQAGRLVGRLRDVRIDAVYSSPLERSMETAEPLAAARNLPIMTSRRLIEIGFGDWVGREIASLEGQPCWRRYNTFRSSTRPPGGELITEVQTRIVDQMEGLHKEHPGGTVALFSHGDVIKSAVAFYVGIPVDLMHRIEISPASVSIVRLADWGPECQVINDTGMFGG